jgi:hypothetical protein
VSANVFTIAAELPFAETLARGLIARLDAQRNPFALADVTLYLPTRRAVRTLGEAFARHAGGASLLPQMRPLGDVDEDDAAFDGVEGSLALPPAIAPLRRRLLLATLVQRWDRAKHGGRGQWAFVQAAQFARSLAAFLDEAETQEADLSKLETLAPANLAEHWVEVRDFLVLLRDEWPKLAAAEGALDPAAHRNLQLDALARRYAQHPPAGMVIAAGTTGSIPATARLLSAIAQSDNGLVILPGLDRTLDEESWAKLDPGHPQFGMKELIGRIGVARDAVEDWGDVPSSSLDRTSLLRETLRPRIRFARNARDPGQDRSTGHARPQSRTPRRRRARPLEHRHRRFGRTATRAYAVRCVFALARRSGRSAIRAGAAARRAETPARGGQRQPGRIPPRRARARSLLSARTAPRSRHRRHQARHRESARARAPPRRGSKRRAPHRRMPGPPKIWRRATPKRERHDCGGARREKRLPH